MDLKKYIRIVEDFPKKGISFKDITTLLKDGEIFRYTVDLISDNLRDKNIDFIVAPEARGFVIGVPVAYNLGIGFIPVRKKGKLPGETIEKSYLLEYGEDILQIQKDVINKGDRVVIIDDLLATGGTIETVAKLVEACGGEVVEINFIIELKGLKGREGLRNYKIKSFVEYDY